MEDINKPHDAFFKNRFSRVQTAVAFCRHYLPPLIVALLDLSRLEVVKGSFTDQRLQEHLADVLYRFPITSGGWALIYILLEHKSYLDEWVLLQATRYMLPVWVGERDAGCTKLPPIIPVVLYHGKEKWSVPHNFSALFDLSGELREFRSYVPEFRYHLCDLSRYNDADIVGGPEIEPALGLMKHIFRRDLKARLQRLFSRAGDLKPFSAASDLVEVMVRYAIAGKRVEEKIVANEMERALIKKDGDIWLPIIDDWKLKGFLEGRDEGRVIGRAEGVENVALSLLRHRFQQLDERLEATVKSLSVERLSELSVATLDFQSEKDLTVWLRKHAPQRKKSKTDK